MCKIDLSKSLHIVDGQDTLHDRESSSFEACTHFNFVIASKAVAQKKKYKYSSTMTWLLRSPSFAKINKYYAVSNHLFGRPARAACPCSPDPSSHSTACADLCQKQKQFALNLCESCSERNVESWLESFVKHRH
jgi:hypothetical protein